MTVTSITDNTTAQNGSPDETFTGTESSYMGEVTPDYEFDKNGASTISTGSTSGEIYNAILRYTGLSNITGAPTVTSATEYLYATGGGFGTFTMDGNGCKLDWVVAEVTWNDYKTTTAWGTAGGLGSGDIVTPAPTSNTVSSGSQWYSWDFTDYIQDVLDGTLSNEGMNHPCTNTGSGAFRFFGRENGTDGERAELLVDWTAAAGGVPLLTLLGVG